MLASSVLATPGAALAVLPLAGDGNQPSTHVLEWVGPFSPAAVMLIGTTTPAIVLEDGTLTVTPTQESSMVASDPTWWVVVS